MDSSCIEGSMRSVRCSPQVWGSKGDSQKKRKESFNLKPCLRISRTPITLIVTDMALRVHLEGPWTPLWEPQFPKQTVVGFIYLFIFRKWMDSSWFQCVVVFSLAEPRPCLRYRHNPKHYHCVWCVVLFVVVLAKVMLLFNINALSRADWLEPYVKKIKNKKKKSRRRKTKIDFHKSFKNVHDVFAQWCCCCQN